VDPDNYRLPFRRIYAKLQNARRLRRQVGWLLITLSVLAHGQNQPAKIELPAATGKYAVGRTSLHWIDTARAEAMTDDPNERRALMVTLWYPAAAGTGAPAPSLDQLASVLG
jgi:hypothetical protein